jgi:hypothetical protein
MEVEDEKEKDDHESRMPPQQHRVLDLHLQQTRQRGCDASSLPPRSCGFRPINAPPLPTPLPASLALLDAGDVMCDVCLVMCDV